MTKTKSFEDTNREYFEDLDIYNIQEEDYLVNMHQNQLNKDKANKED